MRRLLAVILTAVLSTVVAAGTIGERNEALENHAVEMLKAVGAKKAKCRLSMIPFAKFSANICGSIEMPVSEFEAAVDARLEAFADDPVPGNWQRGKRGTHRSFAFEGIEVSIVVDRGDVAISYVKDFGSDCRYEPPFDEPHEGSLTNPKLIEKKAPEYPKSMRMGKHQAAVLLNAWIETDGTVSDICIEGSTSARPEFGIAAKQAMQAWRYEPALVDGVPTRVPFRTVIDFSLRN